MKYLFFISFILFSTLLYPQTVDVAEIGIVLAQQVVFAGLSSLSILDWKPSPYIVGGIDGAFAVSSFIQINSSDDPDYQGFYFLGAGYIIKSIFNIFFSSNYNKQARFLVNYIAINVLIYAGYGITENWW
jgi:hypothetical protein